MQADRPELYSVQPFAPEPWMAPIRKDAFPTSRVVLASLPTPLHRLRPFTFTPAPAKCDGDATQGEGRERQAPGIEIHLKRDDLTSFDLSGNKVRKLEFLLADALAGGYDTVITIGGLQSNHARATAVAARQLGLTPVLILRTELSVEEIMLGGNLLLGRMAGAKIYTVKPEDYYAKGGDFFVHQLAERLSQEGGRRCYEIPSGGSNALGTFGYLHAITELMRQTGCEREQQQEQQNGQTKKRPFPYDHLVFGCGSGGTAAGLAIGVHLAQLDVQVHAIGVCDTPDDFYEVVRHKAECLGLHSRSSGGSDVRPPLFDEVRSWLTVHDGQGGGYSVSSQEELQFLLEVSSQTGVLLDPVYSGKALFTLVTRLTASMPDVFQPGQRVLFVHTGGALGCYAKESQLLPLLSGAAGQQHVIEAL